MKARSNLPLRRVKNRERPPLGFYIPNFSEKTFPPLFTEIGGYGYAFSRNIQNIPREFIQQQQKEVIKSKATE